jgi:hypothetical protein
MFSAPELHFGCYLQMFSGPEADFGCYLQCFLLLSCILVAIYNVFCS